MKKILTLLLIMIGLTGFTQKVTNTWDGSYNWYWHNDANWSLNHIPTSTEDVIIPNGMSRYPRVDFYDEEIKSLTINSAAYIKIAAYQLSISGNVDVYGEIDMDNTDAELACNNITWHSGSEAQTTGDCVFYVNTTWEFAAGADVQLDNGSVYFLGSGNNYIRSKDIDCYFNQIWVNKTGGVLGNSSQSSATCKIKGNLYLVGSNYDFLSYSSETIQMGGNFLNGEATINVALDNGTIEFTGNASSINFRPQPGDYFNNLIVNTGSYDMDMSTTYTTTFEIKNDVTINSGRLDVNSMNLLVGGDWTNNVGSAGFYERTGKVTFNGVTQQYCSDETFYTLEVNKSAYALRMNGSDVVCAEYDWTDGAIDVLSGSFTANELLDIGIAGEWFVNDEVHLHQTDSYVDLLGDLYIFDGGYMHVYGGNDDSYWPYGAAGSHVRIDDGGAIKFHDVGIEIRPTGTLTTDMTGGWIGMIGDFTVDRTGFDAPGTFWAMLGTSDTDVKILNGSIYQLDIAKGSEKTSDLISQENLYVPDESEPGTGIYSKGFTSREGKVYEPSEANTVKASGDVSVRHMVVYNGTFDLNGHDVDLWGNFTMNSEGTLKMGNAGDNLTFEDIYWSSGSSDLITNGNIYCNNSWHFNDGTNAQLGTGNTVHFTGSGLQFFYCKDANAEFGNVSIENTSSTTWLHSTSTYDMHVTGNMGVKSWADFYIQSEYLLVDGYLDIYGDGRMSLYGNGLLTNNSDFVLDGELDVGVGDVIINGNFELESTGILTITTGSFHTEGASSYIDIRGTINMSNGVFESSKNLRILSTADCNITGGIIRVNGFYATYGGTFSPGGGTMEIRTNNGSLGPVECSNGNRFVHLDINSTVITGGAHLDSDILVAGQLRILNGRLRLDGFTAEVDMDTYIYSGGGLMLDDSDDLLIAHGDINWLLGSYDEVTTGEIHVDGNWNFEYGTNAQLGSGNVVRFTGGGSSSIYNYDADASFGNVAMQKNSGSNIYINGDSPYPIYCTGGLSVENNNNFHIQNEDLIVDQGIFIGSGALVDVSPSGSIQDGNDLDIYGTLDVGGAEVEVNGDFNLSSLGTVTITYGSLICNDPWDNTNKEIRGNFNLTGDGLFEMTNNSIQIYSTANCNITDGTFRVGAHFFASNAGTFQPTGGTFEMSDGYSGGQIFCYNGNHFYDLGINDNTLAGEDITVNHDLNINTGTFNVNDKIVAVGHNVNIYSTLQMTNSLGVLECGIRVSWMPGSNDDITAGNIYASTWTFEDSTNAQLGTGNTTHLSSGNSPYDPDAEFGNLVIGAWSKSASPMDNMIKHNNEPSDICVEGSGLTNNLSPVDGKTIYPRRVAGNCTHLSPLD
nr:hypothetical protein [Bacteroidota bacterium]